MDTTMNFAPVAAPEPLARWHSFVAFIGERAAAADLDALRIGARLRLRLARAAFRGCAVEVLTAEGHPLGWLPREEADALAAAGVPPEAAAVRIMALVPAFQRPRIQVEVSLPGD